MNSSHGQTLRTASPALSVAVLTTGFALLIAWRIQPAWLTRFRQAIAQLSPALMACLLLGGLASWLLRRERSRAARAIAGGCTTALLIIAGLGLVHFAARGLAPSVFSMTPDASLGFLAIGASQLFLFGKGTATSWGSQVCALFAGTCSLVSIVAGIYGVYEIAGSGALLGFLPAILLMTLAASLLLAEPDHGFVRSFTRTDATGVMMRRLALAVLVVPIGLDVLTLAAAHAWYIDTRVSLMLHAVLVMVVLGAFLVSTRGLLARADAARDVAESKLAYMAAIVESSSDAIVGESPDGVIASWNRGAERLYGYPAADAVGRPSDFVVPPERLAELRAIRERIDRGEGVEHIVTERIRKDGERRVLSVTKSPILNADGLVIGSSAVARDITESAREQQALERDRAQLEELVAQRTAALLEKQTQFMTTFEQAAIGLAHVGLDGHWLRVNQKICDILAYSREELLQRSFQDVTHPDDLDRDLQFVQQLLRGEIDNYSMEKRYLRRDGRVVWANLTVSLVHSLEGAPDYFVAAVEDINERIEARQQLDRQKEFLAQVIDGVPDPVFVKDERHRWVIVNDALCRFVGHPRERLIGKSDFDFFPKEEAEVFWAVDDRVLASGVENVNEEALTDASGAEHVISTRKSLYRDSRSGARYIIGVIRDITEIRAAQKASARLAAIVDSSDDAILSKDLDGTITSWNPGAERLYGYRADEIIGRPIDTVLPPENMHEGKELLAKIARGEPVRSFETERLHRDGHRVPVSLTMSPVRDGGGCVVGVSTIARDISDRLRSMKALRDSEERFREAFASAPAGIALTASDGRLLDVNDTLCEMLGYTFEELTSRTFVEITLPEDVERSKQFLQRVLQGEEASSFDKRYLRSNGTPVWTSVSSRLLRDDAGAPRYFITHILDISERKKAEAELEAANRELESFAYSVSHDLRAPLRHLSGFLELLEQSVGPMNPRARRYFDVTMESTHEMSRLIDDLLSFSRVGRTAIHQTRIDMEALVQSVRQMLQPDQKGRAVEWVIGSLPAVHGDAALLRQVLTNLLSNALKYTRPLTKAVIEIRCREENGSFVFTVRDNGVGFDPRYAHKLFGVFQRLHSSEEFEGTGIGLAIVDRIVRRHGGTCRAEGAPNEGACFSFTLPKRARGQQGNGERNHGSD